MDVCNNLDFLRVIYFIKILIDVVMIVVPIGLIIMGLIDLSKSVVTSDQNGRKKNLNIFIKRVISAVILFAVPWIVNVFVHFMSVSGFEIGYLSCYENANSEKIKELDEIRKAEEEKERAEKEKNKDSLGSDSSGNSSNNIGGGSSSNKKDYTIFVGDSRTVGMCQTVRIGNSEDCSIAKSSMGYEWLSSSEILGKIKSKLTEHPNSNVVINMGVNDMGDVSKYANLYNDLVNTYPNAKFVIVSVTQIDDNKAKENDYIATNDMVINFNNNLKKGLGSGITYCDVYSKIDGKYDTKDGVHYTDGTYKLIYDAIKECL